MGINERHDLYRLVQGYLIIAKIVGDHGLRLLHESEGLADPLAVATDDQLQE